MKTCQVFDRQNFKYQSIELRQIFRILINKLGNKALIETTHHIDMNASIEPELRGVFSIFSHPMNGQFRKRRPIAHDDPTKP